MITILNGAGLSAAIVPRIRIALQNWTGYTSEEDVEDAYAWIIENAFQNYFHGIQAHINFQHSQSDLRDMYKFALDYINRFYVEILVYELIQEHRLNFLAVRKLRCLVTYNEIVLSFETQSEPTKKS